MSGIMCHFFLGVTSILLPVRFDYGCMSRLLRDNRQVLVFIDWRDEMCISLALMFCGLCMLLDLSGLAEFI